MTVPPPADGVPPAPRPPRRALFAVLGAGVLALVLALGAAALAATGAFGGEDGAKAGPDPAAPPRLGDCFEFPSGRQQLETRLIPCERPHEAEIVAAYAPAATPRLKDVPDAGQKEAICDRLVAKRFGTRLPIDRGEVIALVRPRARNQARNRAGKAGDPAGKRASRTRRRTCRRPRRRPPTPRPKPPRRASAARRRARSAVRRRAAWTRVRSGCAPGTS
ncbi:hypothetical protein GEV43_24415 [Actinomadura sp. J1-007]|uniref:hypothetical protein n=1 Tax=Actinomadura sp. J1-007 TaxID=2661913 RepID=UPI00132BD227|nr:hypothetical protein [Actinomadura sp. J1-007]MWK36895.1 hypothetical protein [Actinomadura sp. J1-007]